jgi:mannose-6-phosphate isomerase-like protein (cupin superfamily)
MQTPNNAFTGYGWRNGLIAELDRKFPSALSAWTSQLHLTDTGSTAYLYVDDGPAVLECAAGHYILGTGMVASVPGDARITGGRGIVITREQWLGTFCIAGPVEWRGRLRYIDGCTDSLLIPPPMMGDPCLNLLYFPPGIDQTMHTHPSDRIGMILSGRGQCEHLSPAGIVTTELTAGMLFCIHTDGPHRFRTPYGEDMRVLAYHPESDFGPTHEQHPMLNRTIVNGVSARFIDEIRTKAP